jgi:hypothetical protein
LVVLKFKFLSFEKSLGFQFSPYNYIQKMEVYSHKSPCPKRGKKLQSKDGSLFAQITTSHKRKKIAACLSIVHPY